MYKPEPEYQVSGTMTILWSELQSPLVVVPKKEVLQHLLGLRET